MIQRQAIQIKNVYPEIEGGRYPVKREVDRPLVVTADISGPDDLRAELKYRIASGTAPERTAAMVRKNGLSFQGAISFPEEGIYSCTIEAAAPGGNRSAIPGN